MGRVTSTVGLTRQNKAIGDSAQRGRDQNEGLHIGRDLSMLEIDYCY